MSNRGSEVLRRIDALEYAAQMYPHAATWLASGNRWLASGASGDLPVVELMVAAFEEGWDDGAWYAMHRAEKETFEFAASQVRKLRKGGYSISQIAKSFDAMAGNDAAWDEFLRNESPRPKRR